MIEAALGSPALLSGGVLGSLMVLAGAVLKFRTSDREQFNTERREHATYLAAEREAATARAEAREVLVDVERDKRRLEAIRADEAEIRERRLMAEVRDLTHQIHALRVELASALGKEAPE